jgi:hypothetical protein
MAEVLTRGELWELVWSEPVRTVASRFGLSDVTFKKYCVRAGVPVPERGHWTKLAAGKAVARAPLPPREPGASTSVRIGRPTPCGYDPEAELAQPPPEFPVFQEPLERVRARIERRLGKLKPVRDLDSPCAGLRTLMAAEAKRHAKASSGEYLFAWEKPQFESGFEKRRLQFLNSLGLGLARFDARLHFGDRPARVISVRVGDTDLNLRLDHPTAMPNRDGGWSTRDGPPGTLRLRIGPDNDRAQGYQANWSDEVGAKIEGRLTEIVMEILLAGEAEYRHRAMRGHARKLARRAELEREVLRQRDKAERRDRERRLAEEKARRDHLFGQAGAWRAAEDLRGFVAAVLSAPQPAAQDDVQRWAKWALAEADALDPMSSGNLSLAPASGG